MIGVLTTVTASGEQESDLPHGLVADYYTPLKHGYLALC